MISFYFIPKISKNKYNKIYKKMREYKKLKEIKIRYIINCLKNKIKMVCKIYKNQFWFTPGLY